LIPYPKTEVWISSPTWNLLLWYYRDSAFQQRHCSGILNFPNSREKIYPGIISQNTWVVRCFDELAEAERPRRWSIFPRPPWSDIFREWWSYAGWDQACCCWSTLNRSGLFLFASFLINDFF
jgi:hypothetical protein